MAMIEINAIYTHYKNGQKYQVIGIGKHSETLEDMVIYQALYKCDDFPMGQIWCRPAKCGNRLLMENHDLPRLNKNRKPWTLFQAIIKNNKTSA